MLKLVLNFAGNRKYSLGKSMGGGGVTLSHVLKLVLNFAGNRKYSWGKSRGGGVTFVACVEIGTKFCRKP